MTTEQLVKTLRYCSTVGMCDGCWLTTIQKEFGAPFCDDKLKQKAADLIEQQAARIKELETKAPRWIPVTERLPENGVPVLINYIGNSDGKYHPDATAVWTDYGCFWWEGSLEDCDAEVAVPITHWMPLPEAPKEG